MGKRTRGNVLPWVFGGGLALLALCIVLALWWMAGSQARDAPLGWNGTLGDDIGISHYNLWLKSARRAAKPDEISGVLWLRIAQQIGTTRILAIDEGRREIGSRYSRSIVLQAALTDMNGRPLAASIRAEHALPVSEDVESPRHRSSVPESRTVLAQFGSTPAWVKQQVSEKLGVDLWQESLPPLDFDHHRGLVQPDVRFIDRGQVLAR